MFLPTPSGDGCVSNWPRERVLLAIASTRFAIKKAWAKRDYETRDMLVRKVIGLQIVLRMQHGDIGHATAKLAA